MVDTLAEILAVNGGTGNVNLYMAAGGTSKLIPWGPGLSTCQNLNA
jgi:hypothetical protein